MAARRLREVLSDVGKVSEVFQSKGGKVILESRQERSQENITENNITEKEWSESKPLENAEKVEMAGLPNYANAIVKHSFKPRAKKIKKASKKNRARVPTPVEKDRVSNKCLRLRNKQTEHSLITIPEGIDENKPKWRKYLDFFRRKKSSLKNVDRNPNMIAVTNESNENVSKSKKKVGVLQRLRNLLKRKNKVAPMPQSDATFKENHLPLNKFTGKPIMPIIIEENEIDDHQGDNNSLDSVSLRLSLCSSTASFGDGFGDGFADNMSVEDTDDESENETADKNPRQRVYAIKKTSAHATGNKKRNSNKGGVKKSSSFTNVVLDGRERRIAQLKNFVLDVDISKLRTKSNKPLSMGKKKEKDPFELEMKMIVAEDNRKKILDGRVTPLKTRHEKIEEVNMFKSCETEAQKDDLRKRIAARDEVRRQRLEDRKKKLRAKIDREKKLRARLTLIKSQKVKDNETKLPCYFEIPVNMAPQVEKPPTPRPGSVISNHSTKMSVDERNEKAMANREKQLALKREKLRSRHESVRSVCEQMKMMPPRYYGDKEFIENGGTETAEGDNCVAASATVGEEVVLDNGADNRSIADNYGDNDASNRGYNGANNVVDNGVGNYTDKTTGVDRISGGEVAALPNKQ